MKALRIPATPQELYLAPRFGFDISRSKKALKTEAAPSLLLEATHQQEQPNKSLEKKVKKGTSQ